MAWFKFWCDAHEHPKIEALSDGEFRLLTRIWALARRSSRPGTVCVTAEAGMDPWDLIRGARVKDDESAADAMLDRLVSLELITRDANGVIFVHDFEEHNHEPPSKTKDGRRKQKAKERNGIKLGRQGVAMVSPDLSRESRQGEGEEEGEGEGEEDKEGERSFSGARSLPPADAPLLEFVEHLSQAVGVPLMPPDPGPLLVQLQSSLKKHTPANAAAYLKGRAEREQKANGGRLPGWSFFVKVLAEAASTERVNGAKEEARTERWTASEWHRHLTDTEREAFFRERQKVLPELGPDAPFGAWSEDAKIAALESRFRARVEQRLTQEHT